MGMTARGFCDPVVLVEVLDGDGETLAAARPCPQRALKPFRAASAFQVSHGHEDQKPRSSAAAFSLQAGIVTARGGCAAVDTGWVYLPLFARFNYSSVEDRGTVIALNSTLKIAQPMHPTGLQPKLMKRSVPTSTCQKMSSQGLEPNVELAMCSRHAAGTTAGEAWLNVRSRV